MSKRSRKRWKKKNKIQGFMLIKLLKENGNCLKCKQPNEIIPLQFHHRDPAKKKNVVCKLVQRGTSVKTVIKEINKCDLICGSCHTDKHK